MVGLTPIGNLPGHDCSFRSWPGIAVRERITAQDTREEHLSRLDQLEHELALERERLDRSDVADPAAAGDVRSEGRRDQPVASVRRVDLPELEERVTESQREAWELGYRAGIARLADQNRGAETESLPSIARLTSGAQRPVPFGWLGRGGRIPIEVSAGSRQEPSGRAVGVHYVEWCDPSTHRSVVEPLSRA